jgi:hypothetical protein
LQVEHTRPLKPVELSYTLESSARSDFNGTLQHGFVAHPKRDPARGELHVISYQPDLKNLSYLVVGKDGRSRTVAEISPQRLNGPRHGVHGYKSDYVGSPSHVQHGEGWARLPVHMECQVPSTRGPLALKR